MAAEHGVEVDLAGAAGVDELQPDVALFAESAGRLLVAVAPPHAAAFAERFAGVQCARIGRVTEEPRLVVGRAGEAWIGVPVRALKSRYQEARP
jgi:phosphoribosylformylglycinamidine synthase